MSPGCRQNGANPSRALALARSLQNLCGDVGERYHAPQNTQLGAGARHAINGAGGFVLADGQTSTAINVAHSFRAIRTHSSHDHAQGVVVVDLGHRFHEHVNGWEVQGSFWIGIEGDHDLRVGRPSPHPHVETGRCDVGYARSQKFVIVGFLYGD